jgi:hypothetical protein
MRWSVFLSYAHAEESRLSPLFYAVIDDATWFDRLCIHPQDANWERLMIDGIHQSAIVLVVGNWHQGHYTSIEIMIALALNKPILFLAV